MGRLTFIPESAPRAHARGRVPCDAPWGETEECDLVARLRRGEDDAFRDLVSRYGPRMYAVVRRVLRNDADAQDALQDAWVRVFRRIGTFEGRCRLGTWLHCVALRSALMALRARGRRRESQAGRTPLDDPGLASRLAPRRPSPSPSESCARRETSSWLRRRADLLPETMRPVLILRDIHGLRVREVATLLRMDDRQVLRRLRSARDALRGFFPAKRPTESGPSSAA